MTRADEGNSLIKLNKKDCEQKIETFLEDKPHHPKQRLHKK